MCCIFFRSAANIGNHLEYQNYQYDQWRYILKVLYKKLGLFKEAMDLQIMFYSKYFTATNILTITKRPDFIGKACRRPKVLQQRDLQQLRGKRADWFCILDY